jgi:hypothetical protein
MKLSIDSRVIAPAEKLAMLGKRSALIGAGIMHQSLSEETGRHWASRDRHERGESISAVLSPDLSEDELYQLGQWVGNGFEKIHDEHQAGTQNVLGLPVVAVQIYIKETA